MARHKRKYRAHHTEEYYKKRNIPYSLRDLTYKEQCRVQGKHYYTNEEIADNFTDYVKAISELRDGYSYPIDEDNYFYKDYLEILEKYRNGEDISNEI